MYGNRSSSFTRRRRPFPISSARSRSRRTPLSILLGDNPGPIPRGRPLTEQPDPRGVPVGLPSELLERRPDIREAEETLVAANAEIGVAKAALFPSISLTGPAGFESYALNKLFSHSQRVWNAAGSLTQPVFAAGALRSGVRLAEAQEQQMLLTYQQTIMNAFQQVSDSLVAYQKGREFREQQELTDGGGAGYGPSVEDTVPAWRRELPPGAHE